MTELSKCPFCGGDVCHESDAPACEMYDGYEEGDVLIPGATGYDIITYKIYYPTGTEEVTPPPAEGEDSGNGENRTAGEKILVALSHYDKQDKVIVTFTAPEKPVDPPATTVPAETEDN